MEKHWIREEDMLINLKLVTSIKLYLKDEPTVNYDPRVAIHMNYDQTTWHFDTNQEAEECYERLCGTLKLMGIL